MILVIDNYDSFTYNLVQYLGELGAELEVRRNDRITVAQVESLRPESIIISPGPGTPDDAGISLDLLDRLGRDVPFLGVCLGHQCIGQVYGGRVVGAPSLMHGKTSMISHCGSDLYRDVPSPFEATRYHSLIVAEEGLPECLEITARTGDGVIMGLRHREFPVEGVQFHPESILTFEGKKLLGNFLSRLEMR
ncbi:MAG: aminodeoxychorismate/anthranilate synthase component II [Candidatus Glassbacteria bacterium]|nr:aminodeoxychorismate/anthranilate synthase component II [Candidatus Glassbacteria bacterium]